MPQRPRFSEVLASRRHELGLTIAQASNVLRLKEQVLIAFEEGDFDNMPKSGYAQGMLSSYARYLGLNPRDVVDLFQEDLYQFDHGSATHDMHQHVRPSREGDQLYDNPELTRPSAELRAHSGARGLLPTSGGYAGDFASFSTVTVSHRRSGGSTPLASSRSRRDPYGQNRGDGYQAGRYDDSSYAGEDRYDTSRSRSREGYSRYRDPGQEMRYTMRDPQAGRSRAGAGRAGEGRRRPASEGDAYRAGSTRRRDSVTTRRVRPSQYVDDLRYDDDADPYMAASTQSGRMSSHNIANTGRPNVRRRQSSAARSDLSRRSGSRNARRGPAGTVQSFFANPASKVTLIVLGVFAILLVLIIFSVSSCVAGQASNGREKATVEVSETDKSKEKKKTETSSDVGDGSSTSGQDSTEGKNPEEKQTETVAVDTTVKVELKKGEVSWVDVTADDVSYVAGQKTGPWSQEFTFKGTFKIEVSDPTVVTVSKDGEVLKFDTKASGVGSLTLEADTEEREVTTEENAEQNGEGETGTTNTAASNT